MSIAFLPSKEIEKRLNNYISELEGTEHFLGNSNKIIGTNLAGPISCITSLLVLAEIMLEYYPLVENPKFKEKVYTLSLLGKLKRELQAIEGWADSAPPLTTIKQWQAMGQAIEKAINLVHRTKVSALKVLLTLPDVTEPRAKVTVGQNGPAEPI